MTITVDDESKKEETLDEHVIERADDDGMTIPTAISIKEEGKGEEEEKEETTACTICLEEKPCSSFSISQWKYRTTHKSHKKNAKGKTSKCILCLEVGVGRVHVQGPPKEIAALGGRVIATPVISSSSSSVRISQRTRSSCSVPSQLSDKELERQVNKKKIDLSALQRKRNANDLRGDTRTKYEEQLKGEQKLLNAQIQQLKTQYGAERIEMLMRSVRVRPPHDGGAKKQRDDGYDRDDNRPVKKSR